MRIRLLFFCLLLLLSACAGSNPASQPGPFLSFLPERGELVSASGTRAKPADVLELVTPADYILMGEGHTNPCDHAAQQWLTRALAEGGRLPAVGLEMVGSDRQPVLDRFLAGDVPLEKLEKELQWQEQWGYPFALFQPLFALALEHGLPLGALNAPRELVKKVSRNGLASLAPKERAALPSEILPPPAEQKAVLQAYFERHADLLPPEADLQGFMEVQSLWDTAMAANAKALRERTGRPVLVIAGAGHVERGWGIAHRLRLLDPEARSVLLLPLRDTMEFDPGDGNAFFYCPAVFRSRLGMTLEAREGRVIVVETVREGRAEAAGIRAGDVLVRAQGLPVRAFMDLHQAGKLAHDRDQGLRLRMERRGETIAVDLGKLGVKTEKK
ncbi:MAG: ChaN family lipoprotein [Desulfovibrionaceae bacterium]